MSDANILTELDEMQQKALQAVAALEDEAALQSWRTAHLGRSAPVMQVFSNLSKVDKELRPQVGQRSPWTSTMVAVWGTSANQASISTTTPCWASSIRVAAPSIAISAT